MNERGKCQGEGFEPAPGPLREDRPGQKAGQNQGAGGDCLRGKITNPPAKEASDDRREHGAENDDRNERLGVHK